jgi:hypothetical protein
MPVCNLYAGAAGKWPPLRPCQPRLYCSRRGGLHGMVPLLVGRYFYRQASPSPFQFSSFWTPVHKNILITSGLSTYYRLRSLLPTLLAIVQIPIA